MLHKDGERRLDDYNLGKVDDVCGAALRNKTSNYKLSKPLSDQESARVKAFRSLSLMLSANDDAIDDLLSLIDKWEDITGKPFSSSTPSAQKSEANLSICEKAKKLIAERDWQYTMMPSELRQEAYVRILVILLIETLSETKVASKNICLASGCPGTTALRYLDKLEAHGLLRRVDSESDGRVTHVELTEDGLELAKLLAAGREDKATSR